MTEHIKTTPPIIKKWEAQAQKQFGKGWYDLDRADQNAVVLELEAKETRRLEKIIRDALTELDRMFLPQVEARNIELRNKAIKILEQVND